MKPRQIKLIHLYNGGCCSRCCRSRSEKADKIPTFVKPPFRSGQMDHKQATYVGKDELFRGAKCDRGSSVKRGKDKCVYAAGVGGGLTVDWEAR